MTSIVVLGMHRSGTSVVTQLMGLLGADLGPPDAHVSPAPDNPRGFAELRAIVDMNERVLAALDASSSEPPDPGIDVASDARLLQLRDEAANLLRTLFPGPAPTAWKDPRTCLTFDFWRPLLSKPAAVVLVLRHPLEIAASLEKRDGTPREVSLALWEWSLSSACRAARGLPMILVRYSDVIEDPERAIRRIAAQMEEAGLHGLALPGSSPARIVDASMRHTRFDDEALDRDPCATMSQRRLHEILDDCASTGRRLENLPPPSRSTWMFLRLYGRSWKMEDTMAQIEGRAQGRIEEASREREAAEARARALVQRLEEIETSRAWRIIRAAREAAHRVHAAPGVVGGFARGMRAAFDASWSAWERWHTRGALWRPRGTFAARRAAALEWAKAHAASAREMGNAPRVTVVVPCRDHGNHLPDLLGSLAAQTESPFRWLIVDDGSSETTTLSVLEDLERVGSEVVRLGKTLGPAGARNAGLSQVATTFAACIDADDVLHPRFLERTADALEADSRLGFVYFDYRHFGAVEGPVRVPEFDEARLLEDNYVVSAAPFRVRAWKEAGGYTAELTDGLEDWEFWIRLIERGWIGVRIPETLFFYRRARTSRNVRALQHKTRIAEQIRARHRELYERALGHGRGSTGNSSQSSR